MTIKVTIQSLMYSEGNLKTLLGLQAFDGERKGSNHTYLKRELSALYAKADYQMNKNTFSLGARHENVDI
jgi:hypothetical protein